MGLCLLHNSVPAIISVLIAELFHQGRTIQNLVHSSAICMQDIGYLPRLDAVVPADHRAYCPPVDFGCHIICFFLLPLEL